MQINQCQICMLNATLIGSVVQLQRCDTYVFYIIIYTMYVINKIISIDLFSTNSDLAIC